MNRNSIRKELLKALENNILVLDGAMGTMIQQLNPDEADYHTNGLPADVALKGCNDVLCLSKPEVIERIHSQYLEAGAHIIETNSFNANGISLADYSISALAADINKAAARCARNAVDRSGRKAWVAGSVGPTNKSLAMSQGLDGDNAIGFDEMQSAYAIQMQALIEGGVDLLIIETVFDALNAKAAIHAAFKAMEAANADIPIIISVTLTESGRTLSGQSLDAFVATISHANPIAIGLNCGFGADGMLPHIESLQRYPFAICMYPNAGLPDVMGQYTESAETMAQKLRGAMAQGKINIAGGCCGTTPSHIKAIAETAKEFAPRAIPADDGVLTIAGLDAVPVDSSRNFMNIGERCNVAGSRKFLRLIKEGNTAEALETARTQVEAGAQVIDINMDDAMLDATAEMNRFINAISTEPEIARTPIMIDSSKWDVIVEALKRVQGRPVVNSISLKEGERPFIEKALHIHRMGAAMVVMAFDENGQADTFDRKIEVCGRAYRLLVDAGIPPCDIIFDPNILAVATGIEQHNRYAADFIKSVGWIKRNLPNAKVSGGLSNLSFSFRGNNYVREAMHSIFLYHAIAEGMDMAIVNAATLMPVDDIAPDLRQAIEDVLFDTRPDATDRLIAMAEKIKASQSGRETAHETATAHETLPAPEKLESMVMRGLSEGIEKVIDEVLESTGSALAVIDGPLMNGMNKVGQMFGEGKLFLPQVVKSARTMKQAVNYLTPHIEREKQSASAASAGKMVIATVKGDVHDIGKNIVDVIMNCNGFEMIDLGVMVPGEDIVERAISENADFVGLSGLITPSLDEMCRVAKLMEARHLHIPLMIGGAGTSALHTAVKIAPCYGGPVVYTRDAASLPMVAQRFRNPDTRAEAEAELKTEQRRLRDNHENKVGAKISLDEARKLRTPFEKSAQAQAPAHPGLHTMSISVERARQLINWRAFFAAWHLDASLASIADIQGCDHCRAQWLAATPQKSRGKAAEAMQLWKEATRILDSLEKAGISLTARVALVKAGSTESDDIIIDSPDGLRLKIPTVRRLATDEKGHTLSLADFVAPIGADGSLPDAIGLFAVTAGAEIERRIARKKEIGDDYGSLLYQSIADRLVEAATEAIHTDVRKQLWGYAVDEPSNPQNQLRQYYQGIRPAIGYPSLPDQSLVFLTDRILKYGEMGITLTENGAMSPASSTTGLIFGYRDSHYFVTGTMSPEQRADYILRREFTPDEANRFIPMS